MFGALKKSSVCWINAVPILCLAFGIAFAQSEPPAPTPLVGDKPPQGSAEKKQPQAAQDQRGTQKTPLFLKGEITTQKSASDAAKDAKQHEEKSASDNALVQWTKQLALETQRLAGYTWDLFFVTAGLMLFTGGLFWANRTLIQDARIATRRQLRAYVSLDLSVKAYPPKKPNRYAISLVIANGGKTWARNLRLQMQVVPQKHGDASDPFNRMTNPPDPPMVLGPNQTFQLQFGEITFRDVKNMTKKKGKWNICHYYVAAITYEDTVNLPVETHRTQLSRRLNTDVEGGISFSWLPTHNCADEDCQS